MDGINPSLPKRIAVKAIAEDGYTLDGMNPSVPVETGLSRLSRSLCLGVFVRGLSISKECHEHIDDK
jgi:hypothetical protein